jgi:Arc/MetJ-type ribon-helix-helix transcriptional regulator
MAHTLAAPQKKLIKQLLKAGPWSSEGEIIRYGLKLVSQELKSASPRSLKPYPAALLARAYRRRTTRARREERAMEQASARPQAGELE